MKAFVPLACVFLLGTIALSAVVESPCIGCMRFADVDNPRFMEALRKIFGGQHNPMHVVKILDAHTQVTTARMNYLHVRLADNRKCHVSYLERPWESPNPMEVKFNCPLVIPKVPRY